MKKNILRILSSALLASGILLSTGCDLSSKIHESIEYSYKSSAEAYLSEKYPDVEFTYSSVNHTGYGSTASLQVSFLTEQGTVHVLNAKNEPMDDYQQLRWAEEARQFLIDIAVPIYGKDISIDIYDNNVFTFADSTIATTAVEYLASNKGLIFGLAVSGAPTQRDTDLKNFIAALSEQGIVETFGIFYYDDYSTLASDFDIDTALLGHGSFKNWVICVDNEIGEWSEEGTKTSSSTQFK